MITREQINELADFEDPSCCALSFYFQPPAPRNKAHKEEAILTKDLAREALLQIEGNGKSGTGRADLERIVRLSQELRGNGARGKAVFACGAQNFWREYDLPAQQGGSQIVVNRHFHLKPLAQLLGAFPPLGIVLVDRHRARVFDLRFGELSERVDLFHPLTRRGRSDGFMGYDGGHAERRVEDETLHHFKLVAETVKEAIEKGTFEKWILGCQETNWPPIEAQLHSYAAQKLLGRFNCEVGHANLEEVRAQAERVFAESQEKRCHELMEETLNQARSGRRGVSGLRRVLNALEMGEVQTLFLGEKYHAQAVECAGCGHLDAHLVNACPVCGRPTRKVVEVGEALLPRVIRRKVELFYVKDDAEFDKVGNIAALLRFRVEGTRERSVVQAPRKPAQSRREGLVGRYRGLASG
jgi:peptide subunit release factor 1 (eRF1)